MRRLTTTTTAMIAGLGLLLTACGWVATSPTRPPVPARGEPSAASSILIWSDAAPHAPALQASAAAHLRQTGVEVLVQTVAASLTKIRDDIATLAPQGQGPDLFVGQSDWVGRLADYGLLAPVRPLVGPHERLAPRRGGGSPTRPAPTACRSPPRTSPCSATPPRTATSPSPSTSWRASELGGRGRPDRADRAARRPPGRRVPLVPPTHRPRPGASASTPRAATPPTGGGRQARKRQAAARLAKLAEDGVLDTDTTLDEALAASTAARRTWFPVRGASSRCASPGSRSWWRHGIRLVLASRARALRRLAGPVPVRRFHPRRRRRAFLPGRRRGDRRGDERPGW